MTAAAHRPAANEPFHAALALHTILLIPRTLIPLLRWAGTDAQVLDWAHIGLDHGQLIALAAWHTRHTTPTTRVTAVATAAGVVALAAGVPHLATYTLLYFAQATLAAGIFLQAVEGGTRAFATRIGRIGIGEGLRSRLRLDVPLTLAALPAIIGSSALAGLIWQAWPPPGAELGPMGLQQIHTAGQAAVRLMVTAVLEECAGALLVIGLARRDTPAAAVYAAGMAARVAYHTYMGASATASLVTATAMTTLYRRRPRVLPLIAAHAIANLATLLPETVGWTLAATGTLTLYTMLVITLTRHHQHHREDEHDHHHQRRGGDGRDRRHGTAHRAGIPAHGH